MSYDTFNFNEALEKLKIAYNKKSNEVSRLIRENIRNRVNNEYSYTINRKTFIDAINSIVNLHRWVDKLYEHGLTLDECPVLNDLEMNLVDLLRKCCNDEGEYSDICYFLYDLDDGTAWYKDCFRIDEESLDISTVEKLWDYIEEYNLKAREKDE